MDWSAGQYRKFEAERNRPIHDLLARVLTDPVRTAVDLGCGPGNSTELLRARFGQATVRGLDSSADMIASARQRLPDVRFEIADIADWADPGPFDLILANAALQWVPDHAALLPRLAAKLAPGGSLAVQSPDNLDEPSHVAMRATALEGPWAARLAGATESWANRHAPRWYHRRLTALGLTVDLWRTTYFHRLEGGPAAVVEWFKGTSLRPFLAPLDPAERAVFIDRYTPAIERSYPVAPDGSVLLPFPRLFFVAVKG